MKTLDRSKPFSEMYGDDEFQKHRYMQNGVKFDDAGNEMPDAKAPAVEAKAPVVEAKVSAAEAKKAAKSKAGA